MQILIFDENEELGNKKTPKLQNFGGRTLFVLN
jgi:hypothetical protein